ncbi:MAG: helix-turn-helix transcriptional regulator [Zoogloea sp.]|nr:helix-turn-helix transcriptional regulator [Zoogloea sp.]
MRDDERRWTWQLAQEIRRQASAKGMTLFELSTRSHVPYSTLCKHVAEGQRMSAWTLSRLCGALGIAPADVLGAVK